MTARVRRQEGQVMVLTAVFMVGAVGLAGLVIDVGSWFRAQRLSQSTVDAAALAGAQALPGGTTSARSIATDYAGKNGGVEGVTVSFKTRYAPNDTITVSKSGPAPGFFSNLFGIKSVTVSAHASAISELPPSALGVAPIAVRIDHPMLSRPGCPCFNVPTTIALGKKTDTNANHVPGAFGLVDLAGNNGNSGSSDLGDWITNGYNHYLALGNYFSDTGAKFDSSQIQGALVGRYGSDLLFPIYDSLAGTGSNASYHVVGWAAFHLTLSQPSGSSGTLSGWFDRVVWEGIAPAGAPPQNMPDLGVHTVALVD
jgi:hypothetical protein